MKITLKDISKDTGLSVSTVSRALAGTGKISTQHEKLIFESAQRLKYPLNNIKTPTSFKKSIYIALVTRFHPGEFYASFYNGFDLAAKKTNINFALFNVGNKVNEEIDYIYDLYHHRFDAAVIFLPSLVEKDYKCLLDRLPLEFPVLSAAPIANPIMDTITFDNYRGGYLVADHFHERGYNSVGIITGPGDKSEALLRKSGFIDFFASRKIPLNMEFEGDYTIESGHKAYEHFSKLSSKPRAIFASNDAMAIGFMQRAQADGLSFPNDIAIAGYDDLPLCSYHNPSLTSVHTSYEELGKNVLDMILKRLDEKKKHQGFINLIPVSLSVRTSS